MALSVNYLVIAVAAFLIFNHAEASIIRGSSDDDWSHHRAIYGRRYGNGFDSKDDVLVLLPSKDLFIVENKEERPENDQSAAELVGAEQDRNEDSIRRTGRLTIRKITELDNLTHAPTTDRPMLPHDDTDPKYPEVPKRFLDHNRHFDNPEQRPYSWFSRIPNDQIWA